MNPISCPQCRAGRQMAATRMTRSGGWIGIVAWWCLLAMWAPLVRAEGPFALRDGDKVVFYGDSITDQRLYTTFVETYVVTRFPGMNVSFVHSGVPGDRVTGGDAGS